MRVLILALLLAGCASHPGRDRVWDPDHKLTSAEQRGRDFAYRRCGGCHNVGPDDDQRKDGPEFKKLARMYNPLSLQRRFAEVSEHGADRMPPVNFTRAEAEDLLAWVDTLGTR